MTMDTALALAPIASSRKTLTGAITCSSMSIIKEIRDKAWVPVTKPAGPDWWPTSSTSGAANASKTAGFRGNNIPGSDHS